MWLFKTCGLTGNWDEENPLDPEAQTLLVEGAERFLQGGGTYGPGDWAMLSEPEQAAFVVANERVWSLRLARVLESLGMPVEAARAVKPVDGGAAEASVGLAQAVALAAVRLQGQVVK